MDRHVAFLGLRCMFWEVHIGKQVLPFTMNTACNTAAPSPTIRTWVSRQELNPSPPSRCSFPILMPPGQRGLELRRASIGSLR